AGRRSGLGIGGAGSGRGLPRIAAVVGPALGGGLPAARPLAGRVRTRRLARLGADADRPRALGPLAAGLRGFALGALGRPEPGGCRPPDPLLQGGFSTL